MRVPLLSMRRGQKGHIVELGGGRGLQANLRARGIREGKLLVVQSVQPWGGPVIVDVEGEEVALGRGMAHNIIVDVPEGAEPGRGRSWLERRKGRKRRSKARGRGRGPGRGGPGDRPGRRRRMRKRGPTRRL